MQKYLQKIKDTAARKGLKDFEIYLQRSRGMSITVKEQKVDALENQDSLGFGFRVLVNMADSSQHKMGFSYGRAFDEMAIGQVIDEALASAEATSPDSLYGWSTDKFAYPIVENYDESLTQVSRDDKIAVAQALEQGALSYDPRVKRARYTSYDESSDETALFNSSGLFAFHQKTNLSVSVMAVAEEGDQSEMFYEYSSTPFWKNLKPVELARSASRMAVNLLGGAKIPSYRGPVVLHPNVAMCLIEIFAPSAMAESVHKKNSCFIGKMGQKIYSPHFTLIDDGLFPGAEESAPFDAEGTPRQKTVIVDAGVVSHLLYDVYWGRRDGVASTGNAKRDSATAKPHLAFSNLYLKPGTTSPEELMNLDRAIWITEVIGMHTADPISGDFAVGMQGFLIEKGEKKPLRSMAFAGNLHELFSKITAIGSDLRFYGQLGAPSVLVEEASISGQ